MSDINTLRIERAANGKVYAKTQTKADLAGNRGWRVVGEFSAEDQIKIAGDRRHGDRWKRVADCTDEEIRKALK